MSGSVRNRKVSESDAGNTFGERDCYRDRIARGW